jgi:tetratricopeptide (TPR) repeat protein
MWMRATFLERRRDFEGAIAIYEDLYSRNTSTSVIANNLASLLSTARTDAESLDRAHRIARRLRDSDFPPYQDTYGWIAYRKGDFEDALRHLEPAAAGLPGDALVQVHYGMALAATDGRRTDAIAQLEKALDMSPDDDRPAFVEARQRLEELRKSGNSQPTAAQTADQLPQPTNSGVVSTPAASQ